MAVLSTPAKPNARFYKRRISGACVRLWLWLWTFLWVLCLALSGSTLALAGLYNVQPFPVFALGLMRDHMKLLEPKDARPLYQASDLRGLRSAVALALDLFRGSVPGSGSGFSLALAVALAPCGSLQCPAFSFRTSMPLPFPRLPAPAQHGFLHSSWLSSVRALVSLSAP